MSWGIERLETNPPTAPEPKSIVAVQKTMHMQLGITVKTVILDNNDNTRRLQMQEKTDWEVSLLLVVGSKI